MPQNVDISKFRHHIQSAQDIYIKPSIGETCYDELLDAVENDDFTTLETTLLNGDNRSFAGLKMALAWWVLYLAYPDLWLSISNSTVQKKTGDNFEPVSAAELNIKRKGAEATATSYTKYLIKYIQDKQEDYTCYVCEGLTPLSDVGDINDTGMALDYNRFNTVSESQSILNIESNG